VSAQHAVSADVALYDRLFRAEIPGETTGDVFDDLNPASVEQLSGCMVEPSLSDVGPGEVVQFERLGYFARDTTAQMVFHRTVGLRDEWSNIQKRTV
jgi:glutaminyl-tRNA synthetase